MVATHDVEFVAGVADRVVVLADGEVVADGPTAEVVVASPAFAPQVAKVLHPDRGSPSTRSPPPWRERRRDRQSLAAIGPCCAWRRARRSRWPSRRSPGWRCSPGPCSSTRRPASPTSATRPYVFALVLPALVAIVLAEMSTRGMDTKALAMLGVLSAIGAALRPLGAGTGGIELVFFLLVLGGRVYGPAFGFVLGSTTLFASALITGGVGPWLPFQMLASSWVGLVAGCLPAGEGPRRDRRARRLRRRVRVPLRVPGQPVGLAVRARRRHRAVLRRRRRGARQPPPLRPLHAGDVDLGWDTGRAITNVVAVLLVGGPCSSTLRRATRKAAFDAPVTFEP